MLIFKRIKACCYSKPLLFLEKAHSLFAFLYDKTLDYLFDNQAFMTLYPLSILSVFRVLRAILDLFDKANHEQNEGRANRRRQNCTEQTTA